MFKFLFGLFIIGCVFFVGSHLIAYYLPHLSAKVAFETPLGPINWLLIGTCALCVGAYKMLSK